MTEGNPIPRISLQTEFVEPKPVINAWAGKIEIDQYKPKPSSMGGGWQWELGVRPLNGFVKGKTGLLYDWTEVKLEDGKPKKGTKLELVIDSFRETFGSEDREIGQGKFVGKYAMFARYIKNWGVNPVTKSEMKGNVLVPVRPLNDDELRQYGLLGENDRTDFEYTPELIEAAVDVLDGETKASAKRAIINGGFDDEALTQRLLNGDGIQYLLDHDYLALDGDTYVRGERDANGYLLNGDDGDEEYEDEEEEDVSPVESSEGTEEAPESETPEEDSGDTGDAPPKKGRGKRGK